MFGINKDTIWLYAIALAISFSYRFAFSYCGYRYYEKVWVFIHKNFPKVSDRFDRSFYILFLYCWISVFCIGVIFRMAGNAVGEYLFIGAYVFLTSPVMMFLNVWKYDKTRAAVASGEPDGMIVVRRRKLRKKVIIYSLCLAAAIGALGFSYQYYIKVYGPNKCAKLAAANNAALAARLKAENKTLGPTVTSFAQNTCYEDIFYVYHAVNDPSLTNVFSYIEDLNSNKVVSSCRSQDDHGPTLPSDCFQYHKDFYKLFLQVDFDENTH